MEAMILAAAFVAELAGLYLAGVFSLAGLYLAGADSAGEALSALSRALAWPAWLPAAALRQAADSARYIAARIRRRG